MRTEFGACFLITGCPCNIARWGVTESCNHSKRPLPAVSLGTARFLTLKVREKVPVNCWVPETRLQLHQDQRGPSFTPWEREWSQYIAPLSQDCLGRGTRKLPGVRETLCALAEMQVTWVYVSVKSIALSPLRFLHCALCKLYLENKSCAQRSNSR